MERIAVFAAMRWECLPVLRRLRNVERSRLGEFAAWRARDRAGDRELLLVKTGIGMHRAYVAADTVSENGPFSLFLSTGCAGGLSPDLSPGDLVVASQMLGDAPDQRVDADAKAQSAACDVARRASLRVSVGPVYCSPVALATRNQKRAAAARGGIAVEMEGGPIAACAARMGVPFLSVRAILDTADRELPTLGGVIDPSTGGIRPMAMARHLVRHPGAVAHAFALQRMMRAASASLGLFFDAWWTPLPGASEAAGGELLGPAEGGGRRAV